MGSCVKHARDAQDKLLWTDKACPAHTQLIMSWKLIVIIIIILVVIVILVTIIMLQPGLVMHAQEDCYHKSQLHYRQI